MFVKPGGMVKAAVELPYVINPPSDGRTVFVVPFFDQENQEWHSFVPGEKNQLIRMRLVEVVTGSYLSSHPLWLDQDLNLPLANLVFQSMSFPALARPLSGLEDVVENLASILELYRLVSSRSSDSRVESSQLAQALLENLLVSARSLYDVLQVLSREASFLIKRIDDRKKSLMHNFPDSFADVALHGDRPRTKEEIQEKYKMPPVLASFYAAHAGHVKLLKDLRDKVVHRGHHVSYVFHLDKGLAVPIAGKPWSNLPIWNAHTTTKNGLGSLRAIFACLTQEALNATTRLADAYISFLLMPEPISPGNRLFLRGPLNRHLLSLEETLRSPWERQTERA